MTTRKTTSQKKPTSTRKTKSSAPSRAKAKPAAVKPTVAAAAPTATGVASAATKKPAVKPSLKKKDLFARVKARASGVKGQDVRVVMDAVLEELGALLVDGDSLNAQPLGTIKVQKHRPISGADVVVCKLRRKKPEGPGKDPLAEAAE